MDATAYIYNKRMNAVAVITGSQKKVDAWIKDHFQWEWDTEKYAITFSPAFGFANGLKRINKTAKHISEISMRNTSPFQGWKELTGDYGTVSFESDGPFWKVYEHGTDALGQECRYYERRIDKHSRETNKDLYERYHLLSLGYDEHDIKHIKRRNK